MSNAVVMAVVGVGYLFGVYNVAIWILNKNDEFLAKQLPKIEQLETELDRIIELIGEEDK